MVNGNVISDNQKDRLLLLICYTFVALAYEGQSLEGGTNLLALLKSRESKTALLFFNLLIIIGVSTYRMTPV